MSDFCHSTPYGEGVPPTPETTGPRPGSPFAPGGEADLDTVMRGLVEVSPMAVVAVDGTGTVVFANPRAQQLSGGGEGLLGQPIEVLVPDDRLDRHRMLRDEYLEEPVNRAVEHGAGLWWKKRDGELVPVDISLTPVEVGPGRFWTFAAAEDVSERLRAQEQVLDMTRSYRMLAEINQAILRSDGMGEVARATCRVAVEEGGFLAAWLGPPAPRAARWSSTRSPGPPATSWDRSAPSSSSGRAAVRRHGSGAPLGPLALVGAGRRRRPRADAGARRRPRRRRRAGPAGPRGRRRARRPHAVRRPAGRLRPSLVRMLEQVAFNLALAVERFEDKARVDRLAAHRRDLSARLLSAQEDERRRLAADLHDDPVQTLAATELRLGMLRGRLQTAEPDPAGADAGRADPLSVLSLVDTVRDGVRAAVTALRDVLTGLEPPSLATSWEEAVRSTATQVLETSPTRWQVVAPPDEAALGRWDGARGAQALRIVQEALINVRDHAAAEHVEVRTSPTAAGSR